MANIPYAPEIIAVVVILILIFVRPIRRLVSLLLRIVIAVGAIIVAIGGVSMLMNNETIFEKPGVEARSIRFFTQSGAATSEKGLGSATCKWPDAVGAASAAVSQPAPAASPAKHESPHKRAKEEAAGSAPSPAATASSAAASNPDDDVYPELITPSYPGIGQAKLFALSQQVINSLGGWKIVNADPKTGVIDCIYTSRILQSQDDIRITVTSKSEINLCSRSGSSRPDSTSLGRYFPGDFGANIGHIKQFTETLEPMMDEVYQKEQEKENAKKQPPMR